MLMGFSQTVDNGSDSIVMVAALGMELRLLLKPTVRRCHSGASVLNVYFHCSYLHTNDNDVWIH